MADERTEEGETAEDPVSSEKSLAQSRRAAEVAEEDGSESGSGSESESESGPESESESASESASESESESESGSEPAPAKPKRRWVAPLLVYLVSAGVYVALLGDRMFENSPDDHYAHLAQAWMDGRLGIQGDPPGNNDWACYDTQLEDSCPNNRWHFADQERYRWYVSFPPLPAAVILPAVAVLGVDLPDRLFWALLAGLGPMLLLLLLGRMRELGLSDRKRWEDLVLTALFAFGTVFFFVAVQGTVWFAAHVVCVPLTLLFCWFSIGAKRPLLAGLMLGLCFLTRPTTAALCLLFGLELLRRHRRAEKVKDEPEEDPEGEGHPYREGPGDDPFEFPETEEPSWLKRAWRLLRGADWKPVLRDGALFSVPILACGALMMWMNDARFGDPFEFGHTYLQIRWRPRIETWGLFNFHYFAKNLAVFTSSLPWLSAEEPFIKISRHGLALWVTTPALFLVLWSKPLNREARRVIAFLLAAAVPVAFWNLCYQNSGWVQFGYRFALDYLPLLFLVLALGRRPFRVGFFLLMVWSIAINLFGAVTFDRAWAYYDTDPTQNVIFQPD